MRCNRDFSARRDAKLASSHHTFSRLHALLHHDQFSLALSQSYRTLFGGRILFHHVNKSSFSRILRSNSRNQDCLMNCAEDETDIDKATGPESMPCIWNGGAKGDLPGSVLDRDVEKGKLTDYWFIG